MSGSLCCSQPAPFSSCGLLNPVLPVTRPPQLQSTAPFQKKKGGNHDWLEAMEGREMQDSEYAQWFYQCNLKVHGFCASLVYFYFILAVGYHSALFETCKKRQRAAFSFVRRIMIHNFKQGFFRVDWKQFPEGWTPRKPDQGSSSAWLTYGISHESTLLRC